MIFKILIIHKVLLRNQEHQALQSGSLYVEAEKEKHVFEWLESQKIGHGQIEKYPFPRCPYNCVGEHKFTVLPLDVIKIK